MTQTPRGHRPPAPPAASRGGKSEAGPAASTGKLTFQWERFSAISREILPLWRKHYAEIAVDPDVCELDPDWEQYFVQDELGILKVLTARSRNGKLAGYVFNVIGPHKHYNSTLFANTEMFWLHPYFRKGWQPVKMMKENLRGLQATGAKIALISCKITFRDGKVAKLLYRLGYRTTDMVMRRVL